MNNADNMGIPFNDASYIKLSPNTIQQIPLSIANSLYKTLSSKEANSNTANKQ